MKFSESLKSNRDFKNVYSSGKSYANKYLVMYVLENGTDANRLGISVSKKVGNSVVRHRLTRLVRESYRLHEDIFNSSLDIVIVARNSASTVGYAEVESALLHLSKLHHILKIFFLLSIFGTGFDSFGSIIIALTVAVLSGVVMSGIPGGGLLGEMLIISLYNFPITAFPIIATIGWIVDPPATSINVCGDTASAMLIDKYIKP